MGEHQQYKPSRDEFLLTGLFGSALYMLLATIILYALSKFPKNKFSKYFFISMLLSCIFEIPRFLSIAITTNYQSKSFYILHIISSIFFFISFTIVCLQWSSLLKLGTYMSIMYSFKGVIISNTIFIIIDIIAMIICGLSSSLHSFFRSVFFEWFTFLDTFKNLLYSSLLFFYGMKLILKFYRYNTLEITYNLFQADLILENGHPIPAGGGAGGHRKTAFGIALKKLTIVLFVTTICFFIRVIMLIFKIIALQGDMVMSSKTIPLFGFIWFTFSDWIPRCIPSFAFVYLMNMKRNSLRRGGNTDSLLKGGYMRHSQTDSGSNSFSFNNYRHDDENGGDEDEEDDLSSLNDQEGEYFHDGEVDNDEYYTESNYSDDVPPHSMKPYAWSEGSDDHNNNDEEEQVVFFNQGRNNGPHSDSKAKGSSSLGKKSGSTTSSSTLPFLSRNHYSWSALSSGFSLNNLMNSGKSKTTLSRNQTEGTVTTPSSSKSASASANNKTGDDNASLSSFTSLSQLSPANTRGGGGGRNNGVSSSSQSGRLSPQQKNDGYNHSSIPTTTTTTTTTTGYPKKIQMRSVEL